MKCGKIARRRHSLGKAKTSARNCAKTAKCGKYHKTIKIIVERRGRSVGSIIKSGTSKMRGMIA